MGTAQGLTWSLMWSHRGEVWGFSCTHSTTCRFCYNVTDWYWTSRVQCLTKGHFDMWTTGAGDQTTNLPPDPQPHRNVQSDCLDMDDHMLGSLDVKIWGVWRRWSWLKAWMGVKPMSFGLQDQHLTTGPPRLTKQASVVISWLWSDHRVTWHHRSPVENLGNVLTLHFYCQLLRADGGNISSLYANSPGSS